MLRYLPFRVIPLVHEVSRHLKFTKAFLKALPEAEDATTPSPHSVFPFVIVSVAVARSSLIGAEKEKLMELVELCHNNGRSRCLQYFFGRVLGDTQPDPELWLSIFKEMVGGGIDGNEYPHLTEDPCRSFAREIIDRSSLTLGEAPQSPAVDAIRAAGCHCSICQELRVFFKSTRTSYSFDKIGAQKVKHLSDELTKAVGRFRPYIASCTVNQTTPRGLTVSSDSAVRLRSRAHPSRL